MHKLFFALLTLTIASGAQAQQKAIYGKFGNQFITNKTSERIKHNATGIAYISHSSSIDYHGSSTSLIRGQKLKDAVNLCSSEKFAKNIVSSESCTGFLIADDLVVTAGHCINSVDECKSMKVTFGVNSAREVNNGFVVNDYNIYQCKRIITSIKDPNRDFSVIQLDRKVSAREIFELGSDSEISDKTSVYMIGHPLGLAATFTTPAPVVDYQSLTSFNATLDSFGGNSGSPVIDSKTNKVLGILVSGRSDFENETERRDCKRYATYKEDIKGEKIQRIEEIKDYLINHGFNLK